MFTTTEQLNNFLNIKPLNDSVFSIPSNNQKIPPSSASTPFTGELIGLFNNYDMKINFNKEGESDQAGEINTIVSDNLKENMGSSLLLYSTGIEYIRNNNDLDTIPANEISNTENNNNDISQESNHYYNNNNIDRAINNYLNNLLQLNANSVNTTSVGVAPIPVSDYYATTKTDTASTTTSAATAPCLGLSLSTSGRVTKPAHTHKNKKKS